MQSNLNADNARALLQSAQQLRTHWSSVITSHFGFAITLNIGIWAFFLKSYIDSLSPSSQPQPILVVVAAALSAIALGLWRLYTHHIDNDIARLYPDMVLFEGLLSLPPKYGTSGFLVRSVPRVCHILLSNNLEAEDKARGISMLVEKKRIGARGHLMLDQIVFVIILFFIMISTMLYIPPSMAGVLMIIWATGVPPTLSLIIVVSPLFQNVFNFWLAGICLVTMLVGLSMVVGGILVNQRDPSEGDINWVLAVLRPLRRSV